MLFTLSVVAQRTSTRTLKLMGSRFDITVVSEDTITPDKYIDLAVQEIQRIESIISSWDPKSETSAINRQAGISPVRVSTELIELIKRSLSISRLTDGAFDISYASMDQIWKFDGTMKAMPSAEEINASVAGVGYENIEIDELNQTVFLRKAGMKIGFGAIGKGYAADKAKALLIATGASGGIINASGDMSSWGKQQNGDEWKIAITNPLDKSKVFGLVSLNGGAVVTSGNYEKYVEFNGKRYTHIIDPRSGYPASGIISVTVFAPVAEFADALATSVFVMGIDVGLDRINQIPQVECIIVDEHGKIFTSEKVQIEKV